MGLFCLKDFKLKTKKHHAFRNGVALLANEDARIQEKCSICERLEGSRDAALKALLEHHELISLKTSGWEGNYQDCGVPLMHRWRSLSLQPPCRAARDPWEAPASLIAIAGTDPGLGSCSTKGNVPALMLGSHVDGTGWKLLLWSSRNFLFTASMGTRGWGIVDLHWAAVLASAHQSKKDFSFLTSGMKTVNKPFIEPVTALSQSLFFCWTVLLLSGWRHEAARMTQEWPEFLARHYHSTYSTSSDWPHEPVILPWRNCLGTVSTKYNFYPLDGTEGLWPELTLNLLLPYNSNH